jgi:anti-anti-sigma regulatory factor
MLRITLVPGASRTTLKVEGKLLAPWVEEFQAAVSSCSSSEPPSLDLSGLSFVDAEGLEILAGMVHRGVVVSACSNFVAELLRTAKS